MNYILQESSSNTPLSKIYQSHKRVHKTPQEEIKNFLKKIPKSKILVVGAGGIGCELLKTLVLSNFHSIDIIDLDTIDISNLNRQFLFTKDDLKKSKAHTAKKSLLSHNKEYIINSHHSNVKEVKFGSLYLKNFDIILNALDNLSTRRHINRLCLSEKIPLIESGSQGYTGQVYLIKEKLECFECIPKSDPKTFAVCTIRDTPDKPVHCISWAKLMLEVLFGPENNDNILIDLKVKKLKDENENDFAKRLFNQLFYSEINDIKKFKNKDKNLIPIDFGETLKSNQNDLIDISNKFIESVISIMKSDLYGKMIFDKDDDISMNFVYAASNLRSRNFQIDLLNQFETKGIAGNIVHAIGTTNAIAAGLIVLEAMNTLMNKESIYYRKWLTMKTPNVIMREKITSPRENCWICGKTKINLVCNTKKFTVRDLFEDVLKKTLNMIKPTVSVSYGKIHNFICEDLEDWEGKKEWRDSYFGNTLSDESVNINHASLLTVDDDKQKLTINILVLDSPTILDRINEGELEFLIYSSEGDVLYGKDRLKEEKEVEEEQNGKSAKRKIEEIESKDKIDNDHFVKKNKVIEDVEMLNGDEIKI